MAGASDKAQFFLEQSVPELKEYERKKIFSPEEISSIAKKRSDFEHRVNARGTQPSDYARYAEFEINVDSLRQRRVKRLKIKSVAYGGQRRILSILDRATRRFPGDIGLLMQHVEHARRQKAHKKLTQILTRGLRLHPTKPELWAYAALHAMDEQGDMTEARSYMQRGLRFCKSSKFLWLNYSKMELRYMAKLAARREILGLEGNADFTETGTPLDVHEDTMPNLPLQASGNIVFNADHRLDGDERSFSNIYQSPALTGGIPIAIFDAAMLQFQNDETLAFEFFDKVQRAASDATFNPVLTHIANHSATLRPGNWRTYLCRVKILCTGIPTSSPDFPKALGQSLETLREAPPEVRTSPDFVAAMQEWFDVFRAEADLDYALSKIMGSTLEQLQAAASVRPVDLKSLCI